jgi:hypothetical protein
MSFERYRERAREEEGRQKRGKGEGWRGREWEEKRKKEKGNMHHVSLASHKHAATPNMRSGKVVEERRGKKGEGGR